MEDEILGFINRRFPEDCHWTDGNCYWFAKILCDRFDFVICYDPVPGHFVAVDDRTQTAYDWHGIYKPVGGLMDMERIAYEDPKWHDRLIRDCVV